MDNRKILTAILAVVIVAAIGYLWYLIVTPQPGDRFTEFYILNAEGNVRSYPRQVELGQTIDIIVGVVNHEGEPTSYRIDITVAGIISEKLSVEALAPEAKWEKLVNLMPQHSGQNQEVKFQLYKNVQSEPYFNDPLRLYIDVSEPGGSG